MTDTPLERCVSIGDVRRLAKRRVPLPFFDLIDGGSGNEVTLRKNEAAFEQIELFPHYARDVSQITTKTKVLGAELDFPFILAPTGAQGMVHPDAEIAPAKAASEAGIMYSLSTFAMTSIEQLADVCSGSKMFQLYALTDEYTTTEMIERAKAANYDALCITVDSPVNAGLERVDRWGLNAAVGIPPLGTIFEILRKPVWLWTQRGVFQNRLPDVAKRIADRGGEIGPDFFDRIIRKDLTWDHVSEIAKRWDGPLAIKGILRPDDAQRAIDAGASCIIVCNHGGTNLDGTPASISVLEDIVATVDKHTEVIQCGGIRRGNSIAKAIGLGATATMAGRPFLYGLAAAGQAGVARTIDILRKEFEIAMKLCGATRISQLPSNVGNIHIEDEKDRQSRHVEKTASNVLKADF